MSQNLPKERIAYSDDPETHCGGDKTFEECELAQRLLAENGGFKTEEERFAGNGSYNNLFYTKTICEACGYVSMLSLEIGNGIPTGRARLISRENPVGAENTTPAQ